jgi:O-antigen/teichoic acid export membrane protein
LGPNSFGQLAFVQSTLAVATTVSALGLPVASSQQLAQYRSLDGLRAGSIAGLVQRLGLIAGAVSLTAVLLFADRLALAIAAPPNFAVLIRLAGGVVLLGASGAVQSALLYGLEAVRTVFIANTFRSVLTSLLLVGGGLLYGLAGAALALSIGELLAILFAQFALTRAFRRAGVRVRSAGWNQQVRGLSRTAVPAFTAGLAVQAALWFGQLTLVSQGVQGISELGQFSLAFRFHLLILFVPSAFAPVVMPLLANVRANRNVASFSSLYRTNVRLNLGLAVCGAIPVVVLAPILMGSAGGEYLGATATLVVLAFAAVPSALNSVLGQGALSLNLVGFWAISDLVLAAVFVIAAIYLVPLWSGAGLATAYLLSMVASCLALVGPVYGGLRKFRLAGGGGAV